jgi:hypothetical protein
MYVPIAYVSSLTTVLNLRITDEFPGVGTLPEVEYGGIERTCEMFQKYLLAARNGSVHLAKAIGDGLRGTDLIDALKADFKWWMVVRPDM